MSQPEPPPDDPAAPAALVRPLLDEGETIWAVYPGPQAIVATDRRIFFVSHGRAVERALSDFSSVRRERDTMVVFTPRRDTHAVAIEVNPDDEEGIQALTIVGLLVARQGQARRTR